MKVAIHQPHYMPWLGYLDRMLKADLFIVLDHVQFERRNYQNRAGILLEGEAKLLTVPVVQRSQKERIVEKAIDHSEGGSRAWASVHAKTLRFAYRKAPFATQYLPRIEEILNARWDKLVDLDLAMIEAAREAFEIRTPLVRSSTLRAEGARSELLLNLCREVHPASTFLGGLGGSRRYLDVDAFAKAGVGVEWQSFEHPRYPQAGAKAFVPGLMGFDLLFQMGSAGRDLLWRASERRDERLAA